MSQVIYKLAGNRFAFTSSVIILSQTSMFVFIPTQNHFIVTVRHVTMKKKSGTYTQLGVATEGIMKQVPPFRQ